MNIDILELRLKTADVRSPGGGGIHFIRLGGTQTTNKYT